MKNKFGILVLVIGIGMLLYGLYLQKGKEFGNYTNTFFVVGGATIAFIGYTIIRGWWQ